jgi:hypothetical protein
LFSGSLFIVGSLFIMDRLLFGLVCCFGWLNGFELALSYLSLLFCLGGHLASARFPHLPFPIDNGANNKHNPDHHRIYRRKGVSYLEVILVKLFG